MEAPTPDGAHLESRSRRRLHKAIGIILVFVIGGIAAIGISASLLATNEQNEMGSLDVDISHPLVEHPITAYYHVQTVTPPTSWRPDWAIITIDLR